MIARQREFRLRDATGMVLAVVVGGSFKEALTAAGGLGYDVLDFVVPDSIIVRRQLPPSDVGPWSSLAGF
ncbi:MAG TPA: hypothetical protein VF049_19020 [Nocardioidaceae bacterium]